MLSLAAVNRLRLTPIIRKEPYAAPAAFERLRTNAFVEAAIGLVIVAVVGYLERLHRPSNQVDGSEVKCVREALGQPRLRRGHKDQQLDPCR